MKTAFAILLSLTVCTACAPRSANDVSPGQIANYQETIQAACRKESLARGDAPEKVDTYCLCSIDILRLHVPADRWKSAYFFAFQRNKDAEQNVLRPYLDFARTCPQ